MNQQENYGCVESGLKLTVMIFVIIGICVLVFGCASTKEGCINQKHVEKFNNSKFNK